MMAAAGEKEACKWCFRKGAQLGEPYCANLTLIDQLKELQNTDAANFLLPLLNGWTLPLLHNMALALFIHNTPESVETARELAQTFFTMFDDKQYRYNVYDYSEFIDYRDEPQRRQLNMCWFNCLGSIQIGKTLRQLYESSKYERDESKRPIYPTVCLRYSQRSSARITYTRGQRCVERQRRNRSLDGKARYRPTHLC